MMTIASMSSTISSSSSPALKELATFISAHRIDLAPYEEVRKHLHSDPELSEVELETGKYIARHLIHELGWPVDDVHTEVGGHGVAAVLRNGAGPVVLLRSDTDALPVREQTGLPYASTKRMHDSDGVDQPVMHACGHDMHMTCLLAAADTLVKTRSHWSGTLELIFQPAEERLAGARAMVADGLYEKIPEPDVLLAQHVFPQKSGTLHTRPGPILAAADSLKITFKGRGAHASQPQNSIDPVVMATAAVQRLQGIVSREVAPTDQAVVTIAAIRGGEAENVIPDSCLIRVNVRTFRAPVRDAVLAAIRRIVIAEARASGADEDPDIETTHSGPATVNDTATTGRVVRAFEALFGTDHVSADLSVRMGSEDFGILATSINKPSCFWYFGGSDPQHFEDGDGITPPKKDKNGEPLVEPGNHSALFAPVMQPTLRTGVDALVAAALTYLKKEKEDRDDDSRHAVPSRLETKPEEDGYVLV